MPDLSFLALQPAALLKKPRKGGGTTRIGLAALALTSLLACGGNSSGSSNGAAVAPPSSLAYPINPAICTVHVPIANDTPSHSGGSVSTYSVTPALPAGLSLDTGTGVISGTPTAITAVASYTVTASNGGGSATASVSITVNDAAPSALTYSNNPAVYTKGGTIAANTPTHGGGTVTMYSVTPALPAGLSLDVSTGVISGTPTAITAVASYTVTASNAGGSATASVSITVNDAAPINLTYPYSSNSFRLGSPIPTDTPSTWGGPVISYSISPALPPGISMDAATGVISGAPTAITPFTSYTVTASNSGGTTSAYLFFRVIPPGPTIRSQPVGQMIPAGQAATFSVLASGTGTLSYQWQLNGYAIYGATSSSYTTPPASLENSGAVYSVVVQDPYGSQVTSNNATLTVTPATTRFTFTGIMQMPRLSHAATRLQSGKVLIEGGQNSMGMLSSAELYDPSAGTFTSTGSMNGARMNHTATLLADGRVLVTGGADSNGYPTSSCELYDPALGAWSQTANMSTARSLHTATLLPNGKVLVAGGLGPMGGLTSAEIYDPATGQFTATGNLNYSCEFFRATLLQTGKVLMVEALSGGDVIHAELYDPSTGSFSVTGDPTVSRSFFTLTCLSNGKVLLAGGGPTDLSSTSCELYDPASGTFSTTGSLNYGRNMHTATLLSDGTVLLAGGQGGHGIIGSAEIYDPATGTCTPTSSLNNARELHSATLLPSGAVLVAGGQSSSSFPPSGELFQ